MMLFVIHSEILADKNLTEWQVGGVDQPHPDESSCLSRGTPVSCAVEWLEQFDALLRVQLYAAHRTAFT